VAHRTASWISMAGCPRQPQKIAGGRRSGPHGLQDPRAVARTLLVPGYRRGRGGTVPANAAALHAGGPRQDSGPR